MTLREHITFGLLFLVVCGCWLAPAILFSTTTKQPERVYYTRYGAALCQDMQQTDCGITLTKCHNGRVYYCLNDVSYEETTP